MKPLFLTLLLSLAIAISGSAMAATCSLEKEVEANWTKRGGALSEIVFAFKDAKGAVQIFAYPTPPESIPSDKSKFQIPAADAKKLAGVKEVQVFKRSSSFTGMEPVIVLPYAESNLNKIKARIDCQSAAREKRIFTEKCSIVDLSGRETLSVVHGRFASLCKEIADTQTKLDSQPTTTAEEEIALSKSIKDLEILFGKNPGEANRTPTTLEAPRYSTETPAVQTGSTKVLTPKTETSGTKSSESVETKTAN